MGNLGLPEVKPPGMVELIWFDITIGTPTAVRVLRAQLGWRSTVIALLHYLRRSMKRDPLRDAELHDWPQFQERLARRQFRAAILLEDVLEQDLKLSPEITAILVQELITKVGAQFIASNTPMPTPDQWRSASAADRHHFLSSVTKRFFNARVENIRETPEEFRFDVTACQFVQLAHKIGRPRLAQHFCAADSRFFDSPDTPVTFTRSKTIASGDTHCNFQFRLKQELER